ncbi:MAG: Zn-ribbon domain-containing OB-fold protein [Candidatus Thermoplasmatota archaeon]|nr:Zn-ribbon domain-containing OB-fold protein [Candidatus Thermoplasmatota archaeon]MDI6855895.1 Zn-ribbon domain-containing OB-fold protein [Candidatus Thermoplasmatota archaeon]
MKERITESLGIKEVVGEIPVWYLYTVGIAGEKFFRGLKQGKLIGVRCDRCHKIYLPPKIYCLNCFKELTEKDYLEIDNEGEIYSFTQLQVDLECNKLDKPQTIAFVKFKNVTGGLIQRIESKKLKIGMKVKVKFDRVSDDNLMNIYFVPK